MEIIVHILHFTDAKTEVQGHKASQVQSGTVSGVSVSMVLGERSAASQPLERTGTRSLGCVVMGHTMVERKWSRAWKPFSVAFYFVNEGLTGKKPFCHVYA